MILVSNESYIIIDELNTVKQRLKQIVLKLQQGHLSIEKKKKTIRNETIRKIQKFIQRIYN